MAHWFLLQNEKVTGPFSDEEIKTQMTTTKIPGDALIWGRPMNAWKNLISWEKELPQLVATMENAISQQMWHYAVDGDSKGPMTRAELINELKNSRFKGEVLVWTKGMKAWSSLYEFHDLLDEIGLNRRDHPRAHIDGAAVIKFDSTVLQAELKSISPGGFSAVLTGGGTLAIGQLIHADISSPHLGVPVSAKSTVQYVADTGLYGFKFQGVNMECKAHIMEYIKASKSEEAA